MAETLGGRIRKARREKDWTQEELARAGAAGSGTRISEWESGRVVPELDSVVALTRALDVEVWWLLTGEPPMRRADPGDEARAFRVIARYVRRVTSRGGSPDVDTGLGRGGGGATGTDPGPPNGDGPE